jgi:high-affinity iron transporter
VAFGLATAWRVCGVAVLREGSEVVLFLYGIAVSGGSSATGMIAGGVLGLLLGGMVSAVMYTPLRLEPENPWPR